MKTKLSTRRQTAHLAIIVVCAVLLAAPAAQAKCVKPDTCAETNDEFGSAVAGGDFNGDGYEDLAAAVSYEDIGSIREAGAVEVIYGTANGLDSPNRQLWSQDSADVDDDAEEWDHFGWSLAAGDFNGDGYDDLAIGVPHEDIGSFPLPEAGAVNVLYGSSTGLSATVVPDQFWNQDSTDVEAAAGPSDQFGSSVAAGDFNGDGYDDLVIGVPAEDVGFSPFTAAGAVNVLYGSSMGLSATVIPDQFWNQDSANVNDEAEELDLFGLGLATGDFNGDGYDDLAVGVPGENVPYEDGSIENAGAVNVLYGCSTGLSATIVPDQLWHQDSANVNDAAEWFDALGLRLATGDFNGDGYDDLAVSVHGEDVGSIENAGAVSVLYGSAMLLSATIVPDQFWHQNSPGVRDVAEAGDFLGGFLLDTGSSLAAGDFNGDGYDDLVIGVPEEDIGSIADAGAVNVLYGTSTGLSATAPDDQFWQQDVAGVEEVAASGDFFGFSLAAGDFNGNGFDDLAIGVPNEDLKLELQGPISDAGAVSVLYGYSAGHSAGLSAEGDQFWHQDLGGFPPFP